MNPAVWLIRYSWHDSFLSASAPSRPHRLSIYDFVTVFQITARAVALAAQKVASLFGQNRITSHNMGDSYREASSVATEQRPERKRAITMAILNGVDVDLA